LKTAFLTLVALLAFAGNSVLCRLALDGGLMDAAGFTSVRLLAGAVALLLLLLIKSRQSNKSLSIKPTRRQLMGSSMLFLYAWCFSLAYLILDTGSGALILFGFVQLTLLGSSWWLNERPTLYEILGILLAFSGLVYWLIPAWGTPSLAGFLLMALAGVAWGVYTLVGRSAQMPLQETSKNFIYCLPLVLLLNLIDFQPQQWSSQGVFLAVISGALTSGLGYAIWYAVLPKLKALHAGVLQLLVPILAAFGGWVFAAEAINQRLIVSALMVLGGVFWALQNSRKTNQAKHKVNHTNS
jgi:drug/metabolite transporter (DMT)-like permease